MPCEGAFQFSLGAWAVNDLTAPTIPVKEEEGDMTNPVCGGECAAFLRLDIGDEENKLSLVKSADGRAGAAL